MKKFIIVVVILLVIAAVSIAFLPDDKEMLAEYEQNPGYQAYFVEVEDANGNYADNFLRLKLLGDIDGLQIGGCHIWVIDPNYMTIDNAIGDANDPNTTLYGSFTIARVWGHRQYEIGFWVFDVADNNDCKWGYIEGKDRGHPNVKRMDRYQK